jgi:hypothetical protein
MAVRIAQGKHADVMPGSSNGRAVLLQSTGDSSILSLGTNGTVNLPAISR